MNLTSTKSHEFHATAMHSMQDGKIDAWEQSTNSSLTSNNQLASSCAPACCAPCLMLADLRHACIVIVFSKLSMVCCVMQYCLVQSATHLVSVSGDPLKVGYRLRAMANVFGGRASGVRCNVVACFTPCNLLLLQ